MTEYECVGGPLDGQKINHIPPNYGLVTTNTDGMIPKDETSFSGTQELWHWPLIERHLKFFKTEVMRNYALRSDEDWDKMIVNFKRYGPNAKTPMFYFRKEFKNKK